MHRTTRRTTACTWALLAFVFATNLHAATETNNTLQANGNTSLTVVVTARKWAEPLQNLPGAVTVQSAATLQNSGAHDLRDAARTIPNLTLGEFSTRRLTFPYVRGIGSGQNDPAVTTCIDGVPQLSYVTANQELLDVERIEYLRGPQGALYGSDTLGGAINIVPRLPSREPAGSVTLTAGSYGTYEGRFTVEGPLGSNGVLESFSGGYATREGFTKNDYPGGSDVDSRESWFGREQLYLPDQGNWDFRLSITAEQDRDGDYALYDLASLRAHPFHIQHDYQGYNDRDLFQPVLTALHHGDQADLTSITAFQWWQTRSSTDLDASPYDLERKNEDENFHAWIQELRLASPADRPVHLCDGLDLRWLSGLFAFDSDYTQHAVTDYRAGGVPFYWPYAFQMNNDSVLNDTGISLFGQSTFIYDERWELGLGLRDDFEHRSADFSSRVPPGPLLASSAPERDFNRISPQATLSYHITPEILAYVEASRGYRAGGFNAVAPTNHASYDQETSWNYEAGLKAAWFHNCLLANATAFYTDWQQLQVNTHVPGGGLSDYYIANGGKATSKGAELELTAKLVTDLDLFAGVGLDQADYRAGSQSAGLNVGGNDLPFAPRFNWHAGTEYSRYLADQLQAFARLEATGTSRYAYDPSNVESQGSYTLCNFRLGVRTGAWRAEGWVKNVLDRNYIPLAIPYGPGTYAGECGAPRTVGVSLTRYF